MASNLVRVAILDDYQRVALKSADWSSLKDRLVVDVYSDTLADEEALAKRLESYNIICAMRERTAFRASLLDKLPNLKLIATTGRKNASIDVEYAKKKGIVVSGTGQKGNSTVEHTWALILAARKSKCITEVIVDPTGLAREDYRIDWGRSTWVPGRKGQHYFGTLDAIQRLIWHDSDKIAKDAFGMKVIAWSPHLTPERAAAAGVEAKSKAEVMQESDIVSIHMVLSETTRSLITKADLELMKSTAFFINTSRGPIVEEQGLIEVLEQDKIAGAALDVFNIEPLPLDHPLRGLKNVTLSPHNAYVSDSNYEAFWNDTVDNISSFLAGEPKRVIS